MARDKEKQRAQRRARYATHREEERASCRAYYAAHREAMIARSCAYAARAKRAVIKMYGGKCACCGESRIEFMTIDHVRGDGAKCRKHVHRGGGVGFYRLLLKQPYDPGKYQVLCFNCNCALGFFGYCPHHPERRRERGGNGNGVLERLPLFEGTGQ